MSLMDKLLAAALTGAVLGAAGCASTAAQGEPTTPAAGDKADCKGNASCKGADSCKGANAEGGDKASCKGQSACKGAGSCNGQGTPAPAAPATPAP